MQLIQEYTEAKKRSAAAQSAYPCRYKGCPKTFAHDGKCRRDHESQHNPPPTVDDVDIPNLVCEFEIDEQERDDMYAYQKALLDYRMLLHNFWDAIQEGDREHILRSVKNKPGQSANIPLDLDLEFKNKTIKQAIKNLGPSANQKSSDRIGCSLGVTTDLMTVFDTNLDVYRKAGKHVKKSTKGDLAKVVKVLVDHQAFSHAPGRKYFFYKNIKPKSKEHILLGAYSIYLDTLNRIFNLKPVHNME